MASDTKMNCAKCGNDATDEDMCFGCGKVVCDGCGDAPLGKHLLADHHPPCDVCGERVENEDDELCETCAEDEENA